MGVEEWVIRYSAIMHDIGKFLQRSYELALMPEHQEIAVQLIDKINLPRSLEEHRGKIRNLIGCHHYPEISIFKPDEGLGVFLEVIRRADRLSAEEGQPYAEAAQSALTTPLLSIFWRVNLGGDGNAERLYHEVMELNCGEEMLPKPRDEISEILSEKYALLSEKFKEELNLLSSIENLDAYFTTLYYLLLKYTFFIPSVTVDPMQDISLFEHLSTTCAISECLYKSPENEIMLIGGDICRIQNFIYSITSEQAAKMLRGRSFYIQLINKTIGLYILRRLGLPASNLIFCGGGVFTIIAPYTTAYEEKLKEAVKGVNEELLKIFNGDLYVAVAYVKADAEKIESFESLTMDLARRLEAEKLKQFADILPEKYSMIFGPMGGGFDTCAICKAEIRGEGDRIGSLKVCKYCKRMEALGSKLAKANYLVMVVYDPLKPLPYEFDVNFEGLGFGYILASKLEELRSIIDAISTLPVNLINVIQLNSTKDFIRGELLKASAPTAFSFDFIGRHVPVDAEGNVKSLDEIVEHSRGSKFLGALKMDVDNAGKIFSRGLGKNVSISMFSTMSRALSLFFDGYLSWLIENENYKDKVYMVYSGGDDLFVLGCWDSICDLSLEIQEKFSIMASKNPCVTISAGLVLADHKWPAIRLAEAANHYLRRSKDLGRNRITMFGDKGDYTFPWSVMKGLKGLKDNLVRMLKSEKTLPKGFLHRLRQIHEVYEADKRGVGGERYKWLLRYFIARRIRESPEIFDELLEIEREIINYIDYLDVPIIWADLETRR
jgi:CRISPR-associated protein Csm1